VGEGVGLPREVSCTTHGVCTEGAMRLHFRPATRLLNEAVRERKSKDNVSVLLLVCAHPAAVTASTVGGPSS